jgi:hypothetical protein
VALSGNVDALLWNEGTLMASVSSGSWSIFFR